GKRHSSARHDQLNMAPSRKKRCANWKVTVTRPPSCVVPFRNVHALYLCERAREDEIEQYLAITGAKEWNSEVAAAGFIGMPGMRFTLLGADNMPACAGGYHEVSPGVWQSWMVGSCDGWEHSWRSITKASRWLMDGLFEMGARRLQTNCLA